MYCPTCTSTRLVLAQRQGVEIDFCPVCRGVWLDRGELDKILARAEPRLAREDSGTPGDHPWTRDAGRPPAGGRRRESWLSELFD